MPAANCNFRKDGMLLPWLDAAAEIRGDDGSAAILSKEYLYRINKHQAQLDDYLTPWQERSYLLY